MRYLLFTLVLFLPVLLVAQDAQIHISKKTYFSDESLSAKVYVDAENIDNAFIQLNLYNISGEKVDVSSYRRLKKTSADFNIPLLNTLPTGFYYLIVQNAYTAAILSVEEIFIINTGDLENYDYEVNEKTYTSSQQEINCPIYLDAEIIVSNLTEHGIAIRVPDKLQNASISIVDLSYEIINYENEGLDYEKPHFRTSDFKPYIQTNWRLLGFDNLPVANSRMSLSFDPNVAPVSYSVTDEDGYFSFVHSDICGTSPAFIGLLLADGSLDLERSNGVKVNSTDRKLTINYSATSIETRVVERLLARRAKVNRILNAYGIENSYTKPTKIRERYYPRFFTNYDKSFKLDEFVYLPTMRETFKRLFSEVKMMRRGLRLFSKDDNYTYDEQPLVLVDGKPVSNIEVLLAADPSSFDSLFVLNTINSTRPLGNIARYGVMALTTKDHSFNNDFQPGFLVVKGANCEDSEVINGINTSNEIPQLSHLVYWNSAASHDKEYAVRLNENVTTYLITIMGQDENGEIKKYRKVFDK